jgi:hypothetical protein
MFQTQSLPVFRSFWRRQLDRPRRGARAERYGGRRDRCAGSHPTPGSAAGVTPARSGSRGASPIAASQSLHRRSGIDRRGSRPVAASKRPLLAMPLSTLAMSWAAMVSSRLRFAAHARHEIAVNRIPAADSETASQPPTQGLRGARRAACRARSRSTRRIARGVTSAVVSNRVAPHDSHRRKQDACTAVSNGRSPDAGRAARSLPRQPPNLRPCNERDARPAGLGMFRSRVTRGCAVGCELARRMLAHRARVAKLAPARGDERV